MSYIINIPTGGGSISIGGTPVSNPNFNSTTPAAPGGDVNVTWQVSGSNISGYVPNATPAGNSGDIQFNNGGVFGGETLVPLAHGGTNADLSATGGAHFVLRQSTVGGAITVSQLDYTDLSGSAPASAWSALTGTLSNGQVIPYADAGISRLAAGSLAIGDGTANDYSGLISATQLTLGTTSNIGLLAGLAGKLVADDGTMQFWFGDNKYGPGQGFAAICSTTNGIQGFVGHTNTTDGFVFGTTSNHNLQFRSNNTNYLCLTNTGALAFGTGNDAGISRLGAASLAIGNGTAGDFSGSLKLSYLEFAKGLQIDAAVGAPTSVGTAGTIGQIIAYGGFLYFCSVTGAAGAAIWNVLTMAPV